MNRAAAQTTSAVRVRCTFLCAPKDDGRGGLVCAKCRSAINQPRYTKQMCGEIGHKRVLCHSSKRNRAYWSCGECSAFLSWVEPSK